MPVHSLYYLSTAGLYREKSSLEQRYLETIKASITRHYNFSNQDYVIPESLRAQLKELMGEILEIEKELELEEDLRFEARLAWWSDLTALECLEQNNVRLNQRLGRHRRGSYDHINISMKCDRIASRIAELTEATKRRPSFSDTDSDTNSCPSPLC